MSVLLFDLDGTLIDSAVGITRCLEHAFARLDHPPPAPESLRAWIGPPLRTSFGAVFGVADPRVEQAVEHYRERFETHGWCEHHVYAGIAETVETLAAQGRRLAVVTSKNEPHARRIIDHLPFGHHFEAVIGASADGRIGEKTELVALALSTLKLDPADCWMIGDRHFDVVGARANGVRPAGVLWGFGDEPELREAGAERLLREPSEVLELA
jgi:phosphoglycolate phosphatase